ncbi:hypothetical protein [Nocardia nova]|uniref:hypothetical protein n=1 Tax=Nocardia nova TaxID=37330 RepID=UPI0033EB339D
MTEEPGKLTTEGKIWRWEPKRATGMIESFDGEYIWFGLNAILGRSFDDISIGDVVTVEYKHAQQDSHNLRAVSITWK